MDDKQGKVASKVVMPLLFIICMDDKCVQCISKKNIGNLDQYSVGLHMEELTQTQKGVQILMVRVFESLNNVTLI